MKGKKKSFVRARRSAPPEADSQKNGWLEPYRTVEEMLTWIGEPNQAICRKILEDNRTLFEAVQGSGHNHQAWLGGYLDHIREVMNLVFVLFGALQSTGRLMSSLEEPFAMDDALLVLFLHDLEKPWKYEFDAEGKLQYKPEFRDNKKAQHEFREKKFKEYGLIFTPAQENALKYVEGEFADNKSTERVMRPLAAFCHLCDTWSGRGWYDFPKGKGDPWKGASRTKSGEKK